MRTSPRSAKVPVTSVSLAAFCHDTPALSPSRIPATAGTLKADTAIVPDPDSSSVSFTPTGSWDRHPPRATAPASSAIAAVRIEQTGMHRTWIMIERLCENGWNRPGSTGTRLPSTRPIVPRGPDRLRHRRGIDSMSSPIREATMLTIRKFLRTLIGRATPIQILLACVIGALLGFLPITNGATVPAVIGVILLLVLDANIFLAGLVTAGTTLVSIATAPIAFAIGRIVIDGPTRPLARDLINGPVTAWLGFDSYLATGGLVLGLVVGIVLGLVISGVVRRLRTTLAGLETTSEAFQVLMSRRTVRFAAWLFFGGVPKGGFTAIAAKRGIPIRWTGAGLAVVVLGVTVAAGWMLSNGTARDLLEQSLARANGATVDVEAVEIDWLGGRATVVGLAVCDPAHLDQDLVRAGRLSADLDLDALLRRRLAIDLVQVEDARLDERRATPGRPVESPRADGIRDDEPDTTDDDTETGGSLEDYLKTARVWKDRLEQIRRTIEDIASRLPEAGEGGEVSEVPDADDAASLEAWLREQIALHGYAGVRASHLIEGAPRLLVRRVEANGVRRGSDADPSYDIVLTALSTEPALVADPPAMRIRSSDESLSADLALGGLATAHTENGFDVILRDLPSADIVSQLVASDDPPFTGGRIDAAFLGTFRVRPTVTLDAPLEIVLRDSTITIGGESATIPELPVRFFVTGRLVDPRIRLDEEAFAEALKEAGAGVLADKAKQEVDRQLDRGLENLKKKTGIEIPEDLKEGIGKGIENLFGGRKDS